MPIKEPSFLVSELLESCPRCTAKRAGVMEDRQFFFCGTYVEKSTKKIKRTAKCYIRANTQNCVGREKK